jgi:hypothetical protein
MGDLPEMRKILDAAIRSGHVVSDQKVQFWITEFSWDTKPPDSEPCPRSCTPLGRRGSLQDVAGPVSLVVWFKIVDEAEAGADGYHYESGLYASPCATAGAAPAQARAHRLRFPFVPSNRGSGSASGPHPDSASEGVTVEQRKKGDWRKLGELNADDNGIFKARLKRVGKGPVRARLKASGGARGAAVGARSLPFRLMETPDRFVPVFRRRNAAVTPPRCPRGTTPPSTGRSASKRVLACAERALALHGGIQPVALSQEGARPAPRAPRRNPAIHAFDVGSGTGWVIEQLRALGATFDGSDIADSRSARWARATPAQASSSSP